MRVRFAYFFIILVLLTELLPAQSVKNDNKTPLEKESFSGLKWRGIGPALTSGRISDFAVNPGNPSEYFVAVGSGHVWKTTNSGITFEPVFDNYGAYSIGCVVIDPNNHHVVWIGTGENTHQGRWATGTAFINLSMAGARGKTWA